MYKIKPRTSKTQEPEKVVFKSSNAFYGLDEEDDMETTNLPSKQTESKQVSIVETKKEVKVVPKKEEVDDSSEWTTAKKKDKKKKNKTKLSTSKVKDFSKEEEEEDFQLTPTSETQNNQDNKELKETGTSLKLPSIWNVWIHLNNSTNWTPDSYQVVFTITNVGDFWKFVNNIHNLDLNKYQFYIMKAHSCPTWEHETNRNGGTCSIRLPEERLDEVIEQLCILVINDTFNNNPDDINGISFHAKLNWGMIKIWNKDYKNDSSAFVPTYLTKKYSATPRYKKNEPEY